MGLLQTDPEAPIILRLARDLVRMIKRGNPWVFAEALRACPDAPPGAQAILLDNKHGRPIARGFYDPTSALAFRACNVDDDRPLEDAWAAERFQIAWHLRRSLFVENCAGEETGDSNPLCKPPAELFGHQVPIPFLQGQTTAFRLFNGEGDGLPGLVVD